MLARRLVDTFSERVACGTHRTRVGVSHEWHLDIRKSVDQNDIGEKGLTCLDGFDNEPIFGKEAQRCVFLPRAGTNSVEC